MEKAITITTKQPETNKANVTMAENEKWPSVVRRNLSGEPQRATCLYERLISEWWGVRLTLLRKTGFLHLRFRYFEKTESDF